MPGQPLGIRMAFLREGQAAEVVVHGGRPRRAQAPGPPQALERLLIGGRRLLQTTAQPQRHPGLLCSAPIRSCRPRPPAVPAEEVQAATRERRRLVVAPGERGRPRQSGEAVGRQAGAARASSRLVSQPQRTAPQPFGGSPMPTSQRDGSTKMQARGHGTSREGGHPPAVDRQGQAEQRPKSCACCCSRPANASAAASTARMSAAGRRRAGASTCICLRHRHSRSAEKSARTRA